MTRLSWSGVSPDGCGSLRFALRSAHTGFVHGALTVSTRIQGIDIAAGMLSACSPESQSGGLVRLVLLSLISWETLRHWPTLLNPTTAGSRSVWHACKFEVPRTVLLFLRFMVADYTCADGLFRCVSVTVARTAQLGFELRFPLLCGANASCMAN